MPNDSISEQLWKGLGDAVKDIREKAVEEPWYGRSLSEAQEYPQWGGAQDVAPSPEISIVLIDKEPERGKEKDQDIDLDR